MTIRLLSNKRQVTDIGSQQPTRIMSGTRFEISKLIIPDFLHDGRATTSTKEDGQDGAMKHRVWLSEDCYTEGTREI